MGVEIDRLEIQIETSAKEANTQLDKLINKLDKLQNGLTSIGGVTNLSGLNTNVKKTITSFNTITSSSNKLFKSTNNLAASFAKMRLGLNALSGGISALKNSIGSSIDYIEVLNYFDAAFGQVADSAVSQWENAGYDSAQAYYNSFSERAKQLTTKMTGFTITESGMLESTGGKSLGINPSQLMNYQAMFAQMSNSMGVTAETSLKLSTALTEIGADLASVKNMDFDKVWTDMASGLAGMSRTLDKYGANIRNVNLQQKLTELGINANVTALNQNEKALLRTIILLDSTRYAWGDLAETINNPANQLRLLQANFSNLARTIGNIFLPIVAKVLPYLNAVVIALQRLAEWIVKLLGFEDFEWGSSSGIGGSGFDDLLGSIGDTEEGLNDAASAAKKLKTQLLGIDELNVLNQDEDTTGGTLGGLGGYGGVLEGALDKILDEYQKAWDEAFASIESRAQEIADKIQAFAQKVWNFIEPFRNAISELWNGGLAKLATFTWTALKGFYEGFLVPISEWAFGTEDKGLTKFVNVLNDLLESINWEELNTSLDDLWESLEPFAEHVGDGLNWFFEKVVAPSAKYVINEVLIDSLGKIKDGLDALNIVIEKVSPVISTFWEHFGEEWNANYLAEIKDSVNNLLSPFESLKNLLEDFSWDNFLDYAKDVAKFAELISNPLGFMKVNSDSLASGFKETAKDKITETIDNLQEKIVTAFDTIKGKVESIFLAVQEYFAPLTDFFEGFGTRVGQIFEGISIIAQAVWITISTFFNENVFTPLKEKFKEISSDISEVFTGMWDKIVDIWLGVDTWFTIHVTDPLKGLWNTVTTTIGGYFNDLWEGVKQGAVSAMNGVIGGIESGLNFMVDAINSILGGFNKLVSWAAKVAEVDWGGVELLPKVSLGRIQSFESGGFPQYTFTAGYTSRYSLFMAGEHGTPEMLGTIGGKTAVAGGQEITGIRDAVYDTGQTEAALLSTAVELLRIIASKDTSVNIDSRELVLAYDERKSRNGYAFT